MKSANITKTMKEKNEGCGFQKAWVGRCGKPVHENGMCEEHSKIKCVSCGAQATHECSETGQFVCGAPLCDDCEHTNATDGTNGNIGFFRTAPLPQGMKEHCKKCDQKEFPWYAHNLYPETDAIIERFKKGELAYLEADAMIVEFLKNKENEEKA